MNMANTLIMSAVASAIQRSIPRPEHTAATPKVTISALARLSTWRVKANTNEVTEPKRTLSIARAAAHHGFEPESNWGSPARKNQTAQATAKSMRTSSNIDVFVVLNLGIADSSYS
jgi:hypothetical protein